MNVLRKSILRCNSQLATTSLRSQSNSAGKVYGHFESEPFTWRGMKKNMAIMPLLVIMGVGVVGLSGFILYISQTRENVVYNRSKETFTESMDPMNPKKLKMRVINQQYKPNPELHAALQYKTECADEKTE